MKLHNRNFGTPPISQTYRLVPTSGFPEMRTAPNEPPMHDADHPLAFPAVLIGSCALAFGPWLVRLSGVGPVAAGFWRLALALPFLFVIAAVTRQPAHWPPRRIALLVMLGGFFFAADLAAWHAGIRLTKLGNATLFGNSSSLIFAVWGLWLAHRRP